MNPKDLESELTRLFEEQRRSDEASAPGFRELMARARAATKGRDAAPEAPEGRWAWRVVVAVAAAASVALAAGLYLLRRPPEPRMPSNAATLADWKAPTDILLQTPGAELLDRLPVLLTSVPGGDAGEGEGAPGAREATPHSTQTKVPHRKGVES
jgi:hypothetical protein